MAAIYFNVKYDCLTNELGTSVIPHVHVVLTGQSIFCIMFMTQGHLQGQKVNLKVNYAKLLFLTNEARIMTLCNTSFSCNFDSVFHK